jgi:hypothetical protein
VGMMAVTYKTNPAFPGVKFPVLHRVVYAHTVDKAKAYQQISYKDYLVNSWLKENCRSPYYHSPGYLTEKFIEFECDQEAVMFALRWA